jgi:hypothetical protein
VAGRSVTRQLKMPPGLRDSAFQGQQLKLCGAITTRARLASVHYAARQWEATGAKAEDRMRRLVPILLTAAVLAACSQS